MAIITNYILTGFRNLWKNKFYTIISVSGLAISLLVACLLTIYVIDQYSYDKHHKNAKRIHRVVYTGTLSGEDDNTAKTPGPMGPELVEVLEGVETMVRLRVPDNRFTVTYNGQTFFEKGFLFADSTFFDFFEGDFLQGNPREALSGPFKVVITDEAAERYFKDEDPIGKTLLADYDLEVTVSGVVKKGSKNSHIDYDFVVSFSTIKVWRLKNSGSLGVGDITNWQWLHIYTYLLLNENADSKQIEASILPAIKKSFVTPNSPREPAFSLQALPDIHLHSNLNWEIGPNGDASQVRFMLLIAGIMLIIGSINFINLATARATNRAKDVGIRKVAGATRGQLIIQFMSESAIAVGLAFVVASILIVFTIPTFNELSKSEFSWQQLLEPHFVTSAFGIYLTTTILSGLYPALVMSSFKPSLILKSSKGNKNVGGVLRKYLVIAQFAATLTLITGLYFIREQMAFIKNKKLGFETEQTLSVPISDPIPRNSFGAFKNRLINRADILGMTRSGVLPGEPYFSVGFRRSDQGLDERVNMNGLVVGHDFIDVMGIPLIDGRNFSKDIASDTNWTVLLSKEAARKMGLGIATPDMVKASQSSFKVVGIIDDVHFKSLHNPLEPFALFLNVQQNWGQHAIIKISGHDVVESIGAIRDAWQKTNPGYPFQYTFLSDSLANMYQSEQRFESMFNGFAAIAIVVGFIGLFGLSAYTTNQRSREFSIRKVLGASVSTIMQLLGRDLVMLAVVAYLISVPLSWYLVSNWLAGFVYRVEIGAVGFILPLLIPGLIIGIIILSQLYKIKANNPAEILKEN